MNYIYFYTHYFKYLEFLNNTTSNTLVCLNNTTSNTKVIFKCVQSTNIYYKINITALAFGKNN